MSSAGAQQHDQLLQAIRDRKTQTWGELNRIRNDERKVMTAMKRTAPSKPLPAPKPASRKGAAGSSKKK